MEIAQLMSVMRRIQEALRDIPAPQSEYLAQALLDFAVARMLEAKGLMD